MPNLRAAVRKRGCNVAREPAVMARPCSVVDQIAISTVDPVYYVNKTMIPKRAGLNLHKKSGFVKSLI